MKNKSLKSKLKKANNKMMELLSEKMSNLGNYENNNDINYRINDNIIPKSYYGMENIPNQVFSQNNSNQGFPLNISNQGLPPNISNQGFPPNISNQGFPPNTSNNTVFPIKTANPQTFYSSQNHLQNKLKPEDDLLISEIKRNIDSGYNFYNMKNF